MSENSYRIIHQAQQFIEHFKLSALASRNFLFFGTGWLIALFMALAPESSVPEVLASFIYFYFLFKFVDEIQEKIKPFPELLLVVVFLLFCIEYIFLKSFCRPHLSLKIPALTAHYSFPASKFSF